MSGSITEIDAAQYQGHVLDASGPVVVDFYSTECPPCEALASKYESVSEVYGSDVRFVKIFRQGNRELAESLGVRSSPTILFYESGVRKDAVLTGAIKRSDLEREIEAVLPPVRVDELRARRVKTQTECDVLIIGGGPAGLTAGIYAAQARLRTILVDRALSGGYVAVTHQVSNFPGFIDPVPGYELAHRIGEQARAAGVEMRQAAELTHVDLEKKTVVLDGLETIRAARVIVATGSSPRPLSLPGETEYRGRGISHCATCDAKYYKDKHVVVVGGGNSAIEEALFIACFAERITVVHQFAELQANQAAQERARAEPKISFALETEPREFLGTDGTLDGVVVEHLPTGERRRIDCDGVFIFVGMQPNLDGLPMAGLEVDRWGYIVADEEMRTSVPGVFAVGDVRSKRIRQMTTAVADGTIAAVTASHELAHELSCVAD
jgi:thioredoxin reductase (NADPH)